MHSARPRSRSLLFPVFLSSALSACNPASPPQDANKTTVTVAVAASMRFAFEEIISAFQPEHPGTKVEASYGSSGSFYAQLVQRAPFDLFLSADTDYPRKLVSEGHAKADFPYALGRLVLWAPRSAGLDVANRGMGSLNDPKVSKISIANPELAPYGRAAEAAIQHYQIDPSIRERLVRAENVAQAAQFVQSGAAQIGLFALSLTYAPGLKDVGDVWPVPLEAHTPLAQSGVILPWAKDPEAAAALRDFILSPKGREILEGHGFSAPQ